jgi:hypothetical protein
MKSIGARVALKLVFAHGPLTHWTLTGQGIILPGSLVNKPTVYLVSSLRLATKLANHSTRL